MEPQAIKPRMLDTDLIGRETILALGGRVEVLHDGSWDGVFGTECGELTLKSSGHMTWLCGPLEVTTVADLRSLLRVYGANYAS